MAKQPNLRDLDMMAFTSMTPDRERRISEAPDAIPPAPDTHRPNQLADLLHPAVQHVKITQVIDRGPKFRSFVLAPDAQKGTQALAWFDPGQYLSVEVELPTGGVTRPFSLCSSPLDAKAGTYMLTLERVEGGLVSDFVWENWGEGTELNVSAPEGQFTYEPLRDAKHLMALVGGSSITPIYAMAKAVAEGTEPYALTILYGTNTQEDTVLQDELKAIAEACEKVTLVNVYAQEEVEGAEHGFITAELIQKYMPDEQVSLFICGPQAMQRALDGELPKLGLRRKFIRREIFGEYRNPEQDEAYPKDAPTGDFKLTVDVAGTVYEITCNTHDTLLNSMERQGVHAPARCRSGECGWCHSRLVSGEVYVPERVDGRREADKQFGYVHPCATFPLSDIVLEVPPFAN